LTPVLPRNSISSHVAGNVATRSTIRAARLDGGHLVRGSRLEHSSQPSCDGGSAAYGGPAQVWKTVAVVESDGGVAR
jgi:hypothetical protein